MFPNKKCWGEKFILNLFKFFFGNIFSIIFSLKIFLTNSLYFSHNQGVLEPSGTVEIKYKSKDVLKTMLRLDPKLKSLTENSPEYLSRESELTLTYEQVAINFADLHDTPGRMKAKGCINQVLQWRTARTFFYYRVKRRLLEEYLKREIIKAKPTLDENQAAEIVKQWAKVEDDKEFLNWIEKEEVEIKKKLKEIKEEFVREQAVKMAQEEPEAAVDGLVQVLNGLPEQQKAALLQKLLGIK